VSEGWPVIRELSIRQFTYIPHGLLPGTRQLIENPVDPLQISNYSLYHHNTCLRLRRCRLHDVLWPAAELADTAWIVRGHSICRASLPSQLPGQAVQCDRLFGRYDSSDSPKRSRGLCC